MDDHNVISNVISIDQNGVKQARVRVPKPIFRIVDFSFIELSTFIWASYDGWKMMLGYWMVKLL